MAWSDLVSRFQSVRTFTGGTSARLRRILLAGTFAFVTPALLPAAPAYADTGWAGVMTASYQFAESSGSGSRSVTETATYTVAGPDLDTSPNWFQTITFSAHWDVTLNFPSDGCVTSFTHDETGTAAFYLFLGLGNGGIIDSYKAVANPASNFFTVQPPGCPASWSEGLYLAQATAGPYTYVPLPSDPSHLTGTDDTAQGQYAVHSTWDLSIDPSLLPTPIVPEAPLALLLPLGAGGLLTASLLISRRRRGRLDDA